MQRDVAIGCRNIAANGHCSVGRGSLHAIARRKRAGRLHRSLGLQRDVAIGCRNIAANGHRSARRRKLHIIGCRKLTICLHASIGFQRDIAPGVRSVAIRLKIRDGLKHAVGFAVFYCNIAIDHGLNGKLQLVRTIQYRNAAVDSPIRAGALHRNRIELIARSLQIHSQGTDGSNLLRPDTRRRFVELGNGIFF